MASKKVKRIVFWCVFGHVTGTFLMLAFVFLLSWAPWEKPYVIAYYSNDKNYSQATGRLNGSTNNFGYSLSFEWIKKGHDSVNSNEISRYPLAVWSDDIDGLKAKCEPIIGEEISFIYTTGNPSLSIPTSIVQISYGEEELLAYEDGKTVFLKYISSKWDIHF